MNSKIENFTFVQACLYWTYSALTELSYLNKTRPSKEIELVNGPPFQFYRIALHYMFTMEYIKLTETENERFPQNHFASLSKLSIAIYKDLGVNFRASHESNLKDLNLIKTSIFYTKLKLERDTKFAHTDAVSLVPLSFHSFSDVEIVDAFQHLKSFGLIMERCTSAYGYSFAFQHADTRTDNFIKFHTNYKEYYYANYIDALKKGYR